MGGLGLRHRASKRGGGQQMPQNDWCIPYRGSDSIKGSKFPGETVHYPFFPKFNQQYSFNHPPSLRVLRPNLPPR